MTYKRTRRSDLAISMFPTAQRKRGGIGWASGPTGLNGRLLTRKRTHALESSPRTAYARDAFALGDHPGEDVGHSGNSENDRP